MNEDIKQIIGKFVLTIPELYQGQERINYIIEKYNVFSEQERIAMRRYLNKVLTTMIEMEASDIEIGGFGSDGFIWMRVYGKKQRVKEIPRFSMDEFAVIIINLLNENQRRYLTVTKSLDFSYTFRYERKQEDVRFRATTYFDLDNLALNMRAISPKIRPIETLEFHPNLIKTMSHTYIKFGLTLVTGITGSGKSSTLDSIIDFHNKIDPCQIVIIASPIEFVHKSNMSIIKHREVGRDVLSFKDGVVQSLRQDPDIIVIGEMRDPDTILASLEVTDTGHKVFSTLHTSSAVESIDRIIAEVHPSEQDRVRNRLADVLVAVVSQKLVPTLNNKLALAKETLIVNSSVKAAIKNNNTSEIYLMINQGGQYGMNTMEQDLKRLYLNKKISLETAMAYANNKTRMQQILSA
ncbi:MAG TPA: ATPase, T2SS/T4P/T4SS family [Ignavibacteriaceae bacterium]|jgi:twitching motility protein PilT|nr:ATPase, T2SS/T4P/T4SS family [Ignavibacteriaceae bacterium]